MQTLKIIILITLLLLAGFLAALNWEPVKIALPGQTLPYTAPLGALLLGAFLIGLVPAMIWYKLSRWTVRRKLTKTEAKLQAVNTPAPAPPPIDPEAALLARARAAGSASDGA
jgi:lipopolysaccharide assembly protein A